MPTEQSILLEQDPPLHESKGLITFLCLKNKLSGELVFPVSCLHCSRNVTYGDLTEALDFINTHATDHSVV